MTLQQLQYVVAVAEHGHFGRAAEACHVTQPTLTMGVRKLEDELDVVLFDRGRHPVRPTEDGRRIVEQARVVLRESEGLQDIVRELHGGIAGRYRVGIIPTLAPYLLPRFLPGFAEAHPEVQLVLDERRTTRILKALKRGTLDVGILVTPVHAPGLVTIPLFHEPFLAYLPTGHPLAKRRRVRRQDLHDHPLWVLSEGHCFREQQLSLCDRPSAAGHENLRYESGSIETLMQLVRQGSGMTLVPELSTQPDDPHVRRFEPPEPVREVSLMVRRSFGRQALVDALSTAIGNAVPKAWRRLHKEPVPIRAGS